MQTAKESPTQVLRIFEVLNKKKKKTKKKESLKFSTYKKLHKSHSINFLKWGGT